MTTNTGQMNMFPELPETGLEEYDMAFKQALRQKLLLINHGKTKNAVLMKQMLSSMDLRAYQQSVIFLASTWRRKSALADKAFEIEGVIFLEFLKFLFSQNFIKTTLETSTEITEEIQKLEWLYSDNPRVMRLIEEAYDDVSVFRRQAVQNVLNLLGM